MDAHSAVSEYLVESQLLTGKVPVDPIVGTVHVLMAVRETHGRVFVIGNGGGAGHASHFVNDLRKIAGMEAYAFDNVSEMTARINDDGWDHAWVDWLKSSRLNWRDAVFLFSVGGGNYRVSRNLLHAVAHAHEVRASVLGVVGANARNTYDGSMIVLPTNDTAQVEGLQAVLWHCITAQLAHVK